jgi:hypothetical protein
MIFMVVSLQNEACQVSGGSFWGADSEYFLMFDSTTKSRFSTSENQFESRVFTKSKIFNANFTNGRISQIKPRKIRAIRPIRGIRVRLFEMRHRKTVLSSYFVKTLGLRAPAEAIQRGRKVRRLAVAADAGFCPIVSVLGA